MNLLSIFGLGKKRKSDEAVIEEQRARKHRSRTEAKVDRVLNGEDPTKDGEVQRTLDKIKASRMKVKTAFTETISNLDEEIQAYLKDETTLAAEGGSTEEGEC